MEPREKITFESLGYHVAGPVLFDYVCWILHEAQKSKIDTLYFLARDGHLLQQIAQTICTQLHLPIQCHYLYCSRIALRIPSYHLIGEEAYQLLGLGGYHVTPRDLLQRAAMTQEEIQSVVNDLEEFPYELDGKLDKLSLQRLNMALRNSDVYCKLIQEKSKSAYTSTMQYFRQEGLLEKETVAIVDSGWTGSMQRSLRQLLESGGFKGQLVGFYFGMYAKPKDAADGTYRTWYFDATSNTNDKILFSNNLFECMLAAPHGMTMRYQIEEDGIAKPCLKEAPSQKQLQSVEAHQKGAISYAQEACKTLADLKSFDACAAHKNTQKLLRRQMAHPTKEEAQVYGNMLFCDDVADEKQSSLADECQVNQLKHYNILSRIRRKFFPSEFHEAELFWPFGTIAFAAKWKKGWYWWNVFVWEWLRYKRGK